MERLTTRNYIYHELDFMESGVAEFFNKLAECENLMEKYGLKDLTEIESAVQKQMPKQPILEDLCAKQCPTCGVKHFNPRWLAEYCEDCGQKLDWR